MSRRALAIAAPFFALSAFASLAQEPGKTQWSADEQAIAQADRDFYQASLSEGGAAWGRFTAPDTKLGKAIGPEAITETWNKIYAKKGFRLIWHPEFARVFGDIGVTSGPYERHILDDQGKDLRSTGTYVTVWVRQPDGKWRFNWDDGTEDKK